ncbi:uncharacterized protein LOC113774451 [Coffea eugenioides]|uniref:DUF4283 domain-containing protein n=1 Tax=Coffea arabica TaxID=13443 RepID=A0A6P6T146_COFAR|nr:uncharacterized protein LOC113696858 [Coffea arabica]XP_027156778.1 uncharacterized protein LOC113757911 [Coffea eugenioides]XP_027174786.1 uncharacterized protein LOC113774451 [Coffea eugenioides]
MEKFALSEKELEGANLDVGDIHLGIKECQASLVGKIKGENMVNFVGMKNFVTAAWSYLGELSIMEPGPNLFQFVILGEEDRQRILAGEPWVIDSQLLVLRNWYDGIEEDESAFNLAPLWVQIWNLPVHWISKEIGRKIGRVFHEVREVIIPQVGGKEGRHLKMLLTVDISQPLLRVQL